MRNQFSLFLDELEETSAKLAKEQKKWAKQPPNYRIYSKGTPDTQTQLEMPLFGPDKITAENYSFRPPLSIISNPAKFLP